MEPSKRFKFDLSNYLLPSGWYYCKKCDLTVTELEEFMKHLMNNRHQEKVSSSKPEKTSIWEKRAILRQC